MNASYARALDILKTHDSQWMAVSLLEGRVCKVFNITWGYDLGEEVAHVTTNISPEPNEPHAIDFFYANEIVEIVDDESGSVLFQAECHDGDG